MSMPTSQALEIPEPHPMNIATISAGFEKGDFLVREEQGNRVYFDFFEEVRLCTMDTTRLKANATHAAAPFTSGIQLYF